MKPLIVESQDADDLQNLGRASVQIVHDLKNQINGLKLYATFLRKRLEKSGRPDDELETVGKLIAGLERAAGDTNALVRFGRPVELRRAPRTDLARILTDAAQDAPVEIEEGAYEGEFDAAALSEALRIISAGAAAREPQGSTRIRLRRFFNEADALFGVVEWHGGGGVAQDADAFSSFAGGHGLRMALAAKIIKSHGGTVEHDGDVLRARLPLSK